MLVYGSDLALLSTKLARTYPVASIVSMKAKHDRHDTHVDLIELLGVSNNIICKGNIFRSEIRQAILKSKDRFRYGVFGIDIFVMLFRYVNIPWKFEKILGEILSFTATAFIQVRIFINDAVNFTQH